MQKAADGQYPAQGQVTHRHPSTGKSLKTSQTTEIARAICNMIDPYTDPHSERRGSAERVRETCV